jgi:hypothetical protein
VEGAPHNADIPELPRPRCRSSPRSNALVHRAPPRSRNPLGAPACSSAPSRAASSRSADRDSGSSRKRLRRLRPRAAPDACPRSGGARSAPGWPGAPQCGPPIPGQAGGALTEILLDRGRPRKRKPGLAGIGPYPREKIQVSTPSCASVALVAELAPWRRSGRRGP